MELEAHKNRHKKLHRYLSELVADFIGHTEKLPSKTTLTELIEWSHKQTTNPDTSKYESN